MKDQIDQLVMLKKQAEKQEIERLTQEKLVALNQEDFRKVYMQAPVCARHFEQCLIGCRLQI